MKIILDIPDETLLNELLSGLTEKNKIYWRQGRHAETVDPQQYDENGRQIYTELVLEKQAPE